MNEFEWPCDKRIAHGPHDRTPLDGYYVGGNGITTEKRCPGVKAHPDTMIGRQHHG